MGIKTIKYMMSMISTLVIDYFKNNINKDTIHWHNFNTNIALENIK